MDQNDAIDIFMRRLANRAYFAPIEYINKILFDGPGQSNSNKSELELHNWFIGLNNQEKAIVQDMVDKTAFSVLFGVLVLIDNQTMGYPISDQVSDFAFYIQTYQNDSLMSENEYQGAIRLNHPKNNFDLHDLVSSYLKK